MDLVTKIIGIFDGSEIAIGMKIFLALLLILSFLGGYIWLNKGKNDKAHNDTEDGRKDDQSKIDDKNKDQFKDAKKSESDIEDIIKNHKP